MKKAGLMAASLGTAALLAVGAGSVVALLADPDHGVEQASANEVKAWTPPSANGARELAGATQAARTSDAQQIEAAAQRSGSASGLPSNEASRATDKAIKDQTPRRARVARGDDDDDDDWGDDD